MIYTISKYTVRSEESVPSDRFYSEIVRTEVRGLEN